MAKTTIVALTLITYMVILVVIGFWASARSKSPAEFFLGGRALGPVVAAISYAASASSAWTLLGLSGAAYLMGISVIWVAGGSLTGMLVAWFWIGPRLMRRSRDKDQITFTDFLVDDATGGLRQAIVVAASLIVVCTFIFYVAAQFQGAGNTFAATFGFSMSNSILLGALIIMLYMLLGGFWAVSVTDTVQGGLMALAAILLPVAGLSAVGGPAEFIAGLRAVSSSAQLSLTAGNLGLTAIGLVIGSLGISLGTFGQPHLMVRFMALRDEPALRRARVITILWYFVVFGGMMLAGLAGHVLHPGIGNPENIFFVLTDSLFPAALGAMLLAAVLSAVMSTADSQLLVAASAIAHDLGLGRRVAKRSLLITRLAVFGLIALSVTVAICLPERIFSRVLFAWSALGAAFGPVLLFRLANVPLQPIGVLLSILTGFSLAVVFYLMPSAPGDVLERVVPFCVAFAVLWGLRENSRGPGIASTAERNSGHS